MPPCAMRERTWYRRSSIRPVRSERADSIKAILRPKAISFRLFPAYGSVAGGKSPALCLLSSHPSHPPQWHRKPGRGHRPGLPDFICKRRVAPIYGAMQDSGLSVSWGEGGVVMEDRIEQRIT